MKKIAELDDTGQMPSMSPEAMATSEMIGLAKMKRELMNRERMKAVALLIGQVIRDISHMGQYPLSPKNLVWHTL